jgi:uncharacterized protein (DUF302 family)
MNKKTSVSKLYSFLPTEIDGFDSLAELALDMRWSWSHSADEVWRKLDPALWDFTQNPWVVLQTVSREKLEHILADQSFRREVDDHIQKKIQAAQSPAWFQQNYPQTPLTSIAYFSMEFMLSEALPIYSGGLGNVAGDQLKAANNERNIMLIKLYTDKTVTKTAAALQAAVQTNHFGVMQVHNLKETMAKKGVELTQECLIFEVCQPQQAKNVLDQNMSISTALPCRISIYEEDGKTILATLKPTILLAMFNTPKLEEMAQEVEYTIVKIMKEAASD